MILPKAIKELEDKELNELNKWLSMPESVPFLEMTEKLRKVQEDNILNSRATSTPYEDAEQRGIFMGLRTAHGFYERLSENVAEEVERRKIAKKNREAPK